ncbi:hypothetical protein QR680_014003 [Steinernema hermaphroditum]|uniref:Uncharacterized protein n=1 Tax=Steinernema hermaphroditum TaxID=289476 RepID=A0AA39I8T3_9BILA|nr:hypothetical protein QR680_014003 [Steinernema hermaphroditum]
MEMFNELEKRLQEVLEEPRLTRGITEGTSAWIYAVLVKREKFRGFVEFLLEKTIYDLVVELFRTHHYVCGINRRLYEIPMDFIRGVYEDTLEHLEKK